MRSITQSTFKKKGYNFHVAIVLYVYACRAHTTSCSYKFGQGTLFIHGLFVLDIKTFKEIKLPEDVELLKSPIF